MAEQEFHSKYSGKLSYGQLAEGIKSCIHNAESLLAASSKLMEAGFYGPASSLCFTAVEEVGKVHILQTMAQYPRTYQKQWKHCWKEFRDHGFKYTRGIADSYGDEYRTNFVDMIDVAFKESHISSFAERIRQLGLYVDFVKQDDAWYEPSMCTEGFAVTLHHDVESAYERVRKIFDKGLLDSDMLSRLSDIYGEIMVKIDQMDLRDPTQILEMQNDAETTYRRYLELAIRLGKITPEDKFTFMGKSI
jgi:AbiV family abortive infection protein